MINLDNGKIFYEKTNFPEQYIIYDWVAIGPGLGLCDVQLGSDFNVLETLPLPQLNWPRP